MAAPCRIVLVRPEVAGNLGSTARVMRNFGLDDLVLVSPVADPRDRQARQMSTHGEAILDRARIVADLDEAVADCVAVAGTSAQVAGHVRALTCGPPDAIVPRLAEMGGRVALVFGPEPSGLSNAEVMRCQWLVHVPTDPTYSALNLAQAVAICCYEWRRAVVGRKVEDRGLAPVADQERALAHLRSGLEAIHFLYDERADALFHAVRHLLTRAGPTAGDLGILHGLARQMEWVAGRAFRDGGQG